MKTIMIPEVNFKVGTTLQVKNESIYIADIVYSTVESQWLVIYHVVENGLIQSTHTSTIKEFT